MLLVVVMLKFEDGPFGGVSETVKQLKLVLLSHSMIIVKLSASNISPSMLSHRISG